MATKAARSTRAQDRNRLIDRILEVATIEFAESGMDSAKIEKISRLSNVSKQRIYYYFGSRQGLYESVIEKFSIDASKRLSEYDFHTIDPIEGIKILFGIVLEVHSETPLSLHLRNDVITPVIMQRRINRQKVSFKVFELLAHRGIEAGLFPSNVDIEKGFDIAAMITFGCLLRGQIWDFKDSGVTKDLIEDWRRSAIETIILFMQHGAR